MVDLSPFISSLQGGKQGFFYFMIGIIWFSDFIIICIYTNTAFKSQK